MQTNRMDKAKSDMSVAWLYNELTMSNSLSRRLLPEQQTPYKRQYLQFYTLGIIPNKLLHLYTCNIPSFLLVHKPGPDFGYPD